ncbi:hypothetical protein KTI78_13495 [Acinetobacter sp. WU_MDCI_Abxe161]|jgi:hypothetical protein|uniref:Uncharacterized protein n=1 Tax=Acinetobacter pittii ANC 4050 TaxID=1217691 RepID=R8YEQ1_ACIPI|nr:MULTISPECIES: hypothetical protein [Acinetobacter]EOQ67591.1 hypothetical protein F931_02643 [Acinetobacter pittii ANC 4050]MCG9481675.1 hypothetical protein [Acinetobacter pittii]MCG9515333.1 hypothetical protein [Acinetobacter pittii]MCU4504180.1 hypothetical protein [Acinetobacter sp. WU_MDCI_Abxe161]MDX8239970.1 hypothetical protein [Acinetobacter pittii]
MDILHQISKQVDQLNQGEQWTFSAQEFYMSHNDFNSLSILLTRESEKGKFTITRTQHHKTWVGTDSVTLTKH